LHAESSERTSTRAEFGFPYAGTRTSADRFVWPQHTYAGDSVMRSVSGSGNSRLYELTHWFVIAVYSRACTSSPAMNAFATLESFIGSDGSWNALRSPSNSDRCVCMPLPGWSVNGFGMNVAWTPCDSDTSFTTCRNVMMLSAVVSASAYRRSISCCPGATSW
jgi:hypothetical protein